MIFIVTDIESSENYLCENISELVLTLADSNNIHGCISSDTASIVSVDIISSVCTPVKVRFSDYNIQVVALSSDELIERKRFLDDNLQDR